MNPYKVLGLDENCPQDEIKKKIQEVIFKISS